MRRTKDFFPNEGSNTSSSSTDFKNSLKSLYLKRVNLAVEGLKDHPRREHWEIRIFKIFFLYAFVLWEIHLYKHAKQNQIKGKYAIPKFWTEYIDALGSIDKIQIFQDKNMNSLQSLFTKLSWQFVYNPNAPLEEYFKQDSVLLSFKELFNSIIPMELPTYSKRTFNLQYSIEGFSWADVKVKANPWFAAYKNVFLANSSEDMPIAKWSKSTVSARVGCMQAQDNTKKLVLYAKTSEVLHQKIQVVKEWTKSMDPEIHFPEQLDIQTLEYMRPPLDILLHTHLKSQTCSSYDKHWRSVNLSLFLPAMITTIYNENPYRGNCHGAALFSLGITSIPLYYEFPLEYPGFETIMEPISDGNLRTGDLIYLNGFHTLIYLDDDLCVEMYGKYAPYTIVSLSNTLEQTIACGSCGVLKGRYDYKPNLDFAKTLIPELLKQPLVIYRRRQGAKCLRDKSIQSSIQHITEILMSHPKLHRYRGAQNNIENHLKYSELQKAYQELVNDTKDRPEWNEDLANIKDVLPKSIVDKCMSQDLSVNLLQALKL